MIATIKRLFGISAPQSKPDFVPATWADYRKAMGDAIMADAHEDKLFYEYNDKCKSEGREYDHKECQQYIRDNWQLEDRRWLCEPKAQA